MSDGPRDGEDTALVARTVEGTLRVAAGRLQVMIESRLALDVDVRGVRRIQFDLEQQRPASLVIVPHDPRREPQVLSIPFDEVPRVAEVITHVSESFRDLDELID
jgi:hypothetical protein